MARNTVMATVGGLSIALLVAAALGTYRAFSYLAAAHPRGRRHGHHRTRWPGGIVCAVQPLIAGLGVSFLIGLTAIWLTWSPGITEYTYVLGVPLSTLCYFVFIWLLPICGAIYYSLVFDRIGGDEVVGEIIGQAREAQRGAQFPMAPRKAGSTVDPDASDANTEPTDD